MSRLIDANNIRYEPMLSARGNGKYEEVMIAYKDEIDDIPTVEERKKGKWILDDKPGRYRCSECLSVASRDDNGAESLSDYCGVCGARMEKA